MEKNEILREKNGRFLTGTPNVNQKYDENYHPQSLIEFMSHGGSITAYCAENNLHRDTINRWTKKYRSFNDAYLIATQKAQKYWEDLGHDNIVTDSKTRFNTGVWTFFMKNRFGWMDKTENHSTVNQNISLSIRNEHASQVDNVIDGLCEDIVSDNDESSYLLDK